jgi:hypothetical protein
MPLVLMDTFVVHIIAFACSSTCADNIFVRSEFPGKWQTSVVLPIPKVSSPAKLSDYRPISLLVCLSKVFEVLMARQMERHICYNNLLTLLQSGFRRHHSKTAAGLKVTEDIRLSMEDGQATVLLLLDFSQVFDMVVHGLLMCKLQNAQNYSVGAGMLVGSYLVERAQFVRSGGQESSVGALTCGVPHGSVLGPLLFISYIDDVSRVIRYYCFHIYVDDLQIYHTCAVSDFQKCIDELN